MPECPRPGHEGRRVVKDGRFGKRQRQRYRCWDPDGRGFHRFVPPLPRHTVDGGVCDTCDNGVSTHQGPTAMRASLDQTREIAEALGRISAGASYTEAARRVRERYWGTAGTGRRASGTVANGQNVADWLAAFGPVVAEPHVEERWPDSVVLNDTEFTWTNPSGGGRLRLFSVLAAWGYPANQPRGRLWQLEASPTTAATDWERFLRPLPGRPSVVVADRDRGIAVGLLSRVPQTRTAGLPYLTSPAARSPHPCAAGCWQARGHWMWAIV